MRIDLGLSVGRRPEREYAQRWSLYSKQRAGWLDVVFATEQEAREALGVLSGKATREPPGAAHRIATVS